MTTTVGPMMHDELESVVSALSTKFPSRSPTEIGRVVADVYEQLATGATITAHLIPLTLNRSRRVLSAIPVLESSGDAALAQPVRDRCGFEVGPYADVRGDQRPQTSPSARA